MAVAIPYVRDLDVVHGRVDRVSPLVRRVVAANANKFTYKGTGTYLVGRGDVAVLDAGPAVPEHVDAVLAALEPGERITHLFVTHTHSDHSPATALVQARTGAPSHGYGPHGAVPPDDPDDRVVFGDPDADGETEKAEHDKARSEAIARGEPPPDELREGADVDFTPDVVLRDGDVVRGDGWTMTAVHTPGHTSNHLCFALAEERILFTGDHVMGWSTSVIGPPDGNLGQYLASLDVLLARSSDAVYWPTHGPAITRPHELVRAYRDHRRERTEQLLAALRNGPATLAQLVPVLYTATTPKTLWRAAAASLYAHVLDQVERGAVTCEGEPRRTAVYRLAGR
jgi:glyoxylase-like metal-dependent hydrolase (beta-lactamase superfamily II)